MTVVGDPNRFAAEFTMIACANNLERWKFGHFRLWSNGAAIGSFARQESLNALCASLKELVKWKGRRGSLVLFDKPASFVLAVTKNALFGEAATEAHALQAWQTYGGFRALDGDFDCFAGWDACIVELNGVARYIWADPNDVVQEATLRAGEYDEVLQQAINEIEQEEP